jgi:hypothetical protein
MLKRLRVLALLAATALAGCASVDASDIQKFGVATAAVAQAARDAGTLNQAMGDKRDVEKEAYLFTNGNRAYAFPPKGSPSQADIDRHWNQRIAFAQALSDYGHALAKAAAGVAGDQLDTSLSNLQTAATTVAPKLTERKSFDAASSGISLIAHKAITEVEYRRIQHIAAQAHPSIVKGRMLLAEDFRVMARNARSSYLDWSLWQKASLNAIQSRSSGRERYDAYYDFLKNRDDMQTAVAALVPHSSTDRPSYEVLLDKLIAAHKTLADGTPDPENLEQFIAAAKELQAAVEPFLGDRG